MKRKGMAVRIILAAAAAFFAGCAPIKAAAPENLPER